MGNKFEETVWLVMILQLEMLRETEGFRMIGSLTGWPP